MASSPSRPIVLVVEDEVDLAEVYRLWLHDTYDIRVAQDGETALSMLDDEIDVVLLDRLMPGMTGDEVLDTIREQGLDCRVAMVTAVEPDVDIISLGFDSYVTKPVSRDELRETVERLLDRSDYADALLQYAALVEKRATLLTSKSAEDLRENGDFRTLEARIETLKAQLDDQAEMLNDDETFETLLRDLTDPQ